MSYVIRPAKVSDAARITEINGSALGYACNVRDVQSQLVRVLTRPGDRVLVACDEEGGEALGFVHAADYETLHSGSQKNIVSLAVDLAYHGQGLGRMLTEAVEAWARACGCNAVRLVSSFARTGAHAFYLRCGYRLRKEQKNFIKELEPNEVSQADQR